MWRPSQQSSSIQILNLRNSNRHIRPGQGRARRPMRRLPECHLGPHPKIRCEQGGIGGRGARNKAVTTITAPTKPAKVLKDPDNPVQGYKTDEGEDLLWKEELRINANQKVNLRNGY
mmetsp:Transcript_23923/g.49539  ORF Transcript_23923/g.49539 Transcript_23923/m.49539 type:complete len:117 (-) Transcript_23923:1657-2007(-)